jgi:hypothetical protein
MIPYFIIFLLVVNKQSENQKIIDWYKTTMEKHSQQLELVV